MKNNDYGLKTYWVAPPARSFSSAFLTAPGEWRYVAAGMSVETQDCIESYTIIGLEERVIDIPVSKVLGKQKHAWKRQGWV
jgi:hypothetical protein